MEERVLSNILQLVFPNLSKIFNKNSADVTNTDITESPNKVALKESS